MGFATNKCTSNSTIMKVVLVLSAVMACGLAVRFGGDGVSNIQCLLDNLFSNHFVMIELE